MFDITFLGTASMQPTKERNLSSVLVSNGNENILVDCGEGAQRQFKISGLKPTKITKILISHWHADHVLGLGGLMRYLGANEYNGILEIYGPKGINKYFENILHSSIYNELVKYKLFELKEGKLFENKFFSVEAYKLEHTADCFGFSFTEKDKRKININYLKKFGLKQNPILGKLQNGKDIVWEGKKIKAKDATFLVKGKKVSFILDTGYCNKTLKIAKDSDLVISEATYSHEHKDKAIAYKHLTAKQAAEIAKRSKAKELILTHFSQRYENANILLKEAKSVFKNVRLADDFMNVKV